MPHPPTPHCLSFCALLCAPVPRSNPQDQETPDDLSPSLHHRQQPYILAAPDMTEALAQFGLEVAYQSAADLARSVRSDDTARGSIVKTAGFTPEQ